MIHFVPTEDCSPKRLSTGVWVAVLVAAITLMAAAVVPAEDKTKDDYGMTRVGESLFAAYCTSCHGATAEGNGTLATSLRVTPADLTLIQQNNDGTFPLEDVVRKIDGTEKVKGHGSSDMPIWGKAFKQVGENVTGEQIDDKVKALAFYVRSLQAAS